MEKVAAFIDRSVAGLPQRMTSSPVGGHRSSQNPPLGCFFSLFNVKDRLDGNCPMKFGLNLELLEASERGFYVTERMPCSVS